MSEFIKGRNLFSVFDRTDDLKSLAEAIEVLEEILDDKDADASQNALKLLTTYKDNQISKAKQVLLLETNVDQYKKHWNILNEFAAIIDEKELKMIMNELLAKESKIQIDGLIMEAVKLQAAGKEEDRAKKIDFFVKDLTKRWWKEEF